MGRARVIRAIKVSVSPVNGTEAGGAGWSIVPDRAFMRTADTSGLVTLAGEWLEGGGPMQAEGIRRPRIAVVGSGISGLSASWLASRAADVSIHEADGRLGGHSCTVDVESGREKIAVDMGFIVYNERAYPNLVALFDHLGVATEASNMSLAISLDSGRFEYGGGSLSQLFAQKRNALSPRFWSMVRDIVRFYRSAPMHVAQLMEIGRAHV